MTLVILGSNKEEPSRPEIMKANQEKYWRKKLNSLEKAKKQIESQLADYELNMNVVI